MVYSFPSSLVTYRQPMPLQLCDVSHYRLMRSNTKKKNLQGNIIIVPLLVENASIWEILKASQFYL
jgi:hypothetical protein